MERPMTAAQRAAPALALVLAAACSGLPHQAHAAGPACQPRNLDFGDPAVSWIHQPLSKLKRDTVFTRVQEDGVTVLKAVAERSASLYVTPVDRATGVPATIEWRWRTDALVPGADNRERKREDAPLRVLVAFDGDRSRLPEAERKRHERAQSLSGRPPPYAALMYIWSDGVPVGTVIPSAHTTQLKMLVVASGSEGLGRWHTVRRDIAADFRQAFGQAPGRALGVAVMTDTDNTGATAEGRYAAIRLGCSR
jgi:hypothetical protein